MTLWTVAFFSLLLAIPNFEPIFAKLKAHFFQNQKLESLKRSIAHLRVIRESLESGLVPSREDWASIGSLPAPWGPLFSTSLSELRNLGAPILPSIERMMLSLEEERELALEAKTKSSQALGQILISVLLVPSFGLMLYLLLPGLAQAKALFGGLVICCILLGFLAFFWMLQMMEDARFGRISRHRRGWILSSKIFFERMVADISGGHPPDLAWGRAIQALHRQEPDLLLHWGGQIWEGIPSKNAGLQPVEESIAQFGVEIRRAVQQSLTGGTGCMDRLDSIYRSYIIDLKMKITRELQVLPNHCLKPLFILVLPSVLLLLFGGMAIAFTEIVS